MRRFFKFIQSSLLIMSMTTSAVIFAAPTEFIVNYHQQNSYVNFSAVPRLNQAVLSILHKEKIDSKKVNWLSSSLFDLSAPYAFRHRVLSMVTDQANIADNHDDRTYWNHLLTQLEHWQYSKRIFLPVDPDMTGLNKDDNPTLAGKWFLRLNENPNTVWVLGQVDRPGKYEWRNRTSARQYIKSAHWESYTEFVYVIQPDGRVEKQSVAYWKDNFLEVAPGAIIFVPMPFIQSSLHPEYTINNPNDMIVELLRNRIQ
ncbi:MULTISPECIES: capsule biosynthesis GfcC family protein [Vibrio]|uniref:Polysaccharide synthesis n=2 Tax=Vibrio TaxID=662 RepID=A0A7X4LQR4_9VIBR|nr:MULTISPECIES: capsule biosynthesis GfcC family protein [Vibrio]MBF9001218.1 capsule biosynthesis GfcC family protein [Vibrio nitrifigilis]MZI96031.1 polysaccharide synthesis [Vibrio eleionomae]